MSAENDPTLPEILPIEKAPYRIRREHYRRERRNSIIALTVLVVTAGLVVFGVWWLVR